MQKARIAAAAPISGANRSIEVWTADDGRQNGCSAKPVAKKASISPPGRRRPRRLYWACSIICSKTAAEYRGHLGRFGRRDERGDGRDGLARGGRRPHARGWPISGGP